MNNREKLTANRLRWLAAVVFGGCFYGLVGWYITRIGCFADDHLEMLIARRSSLWDLIRLREMPAPLHLLAWKAAIGFSPATPWVVIRWYTLAVHMANAVLTGVVLRHLTTCRAAVTGALVVLFFRPGDEALLWATTGKEVTLLFWILAALWIWVRFQESPARRIWAVIPVLCAFLTKPTAVLFVPFLGLYLLLIEREGRWQDRIRNNALPAVSVVLVSACIFGAIWTHPGPWETHRDLLKGFNAVNYFDLGIQALSGSLLMTWPDWQNYAEATGFFLFMLFLIFCWRLEKRIVFGMLWILIFSIIPTMSFGYMAGRYLYVGAFGVALVWVAVLEWLESWHRFLRILFPVWITVWMSAAGVLFIRDAEKYEQLGEIGIQLIREFKNHREDLRQASEFTLIGMVPPLHPILMPSYWFMEYHLGFSRPNKYVMGPPDCSVITDELCLTIPIEIKGVRKCLSEKGSSCIELHPVRRTQ